MSWMLSSRLEGYERLLSTQPFLAGERLTLADLFHVPHGVKVLQVCSGSRTDRCCCICYAGRFEALQQPD